jgi:hypothetical protein
MFQDYGQRRSDLIMMLRDFSQQKRDERLMLDMNAEQKTILGYTLQLELDELRAHDCEFSQLHDDVLHPINSTTDTIIADFENSDSKIDETANTNGIDGMHHGRKSGPDIQQNIFQNRIKRKNQEIEHGIDPKKK